MSPSRLQKHLPVIAVNVLAVLLIAGGFGAYYRLRKPKKTSSEFTGRCAGFNRFVPDPELGLRPAASCETRDVKKTEDGQEVWDTVYTTDALGLRVGPSVGADARDVVLFFGDSFTWGDGVRDEEAYPYRVQVLAGGKLRALNYGFSGWGPNHVLRELELGREVPAIAGRHVADAFFLGIPPHHERITGHTFWAKGTPRYILGPHGLESAGVFQDNITDPEPPGPPIGFFRADPRNDPKRIELMVAIVSRIRDIVRERHGVELGVLWWSEPDEPTLKALQAKGLRVIPVSEMFANQPTFPRHAYFFPHDGHPTAAGHAVIAEGVWKLLQQQAR
jgi:hypothetical protein